MNVSLENIKPKGIYTGSQVIKETGIPSSSFYKYVKMGRIPKHTRIFDGKTVFLGHELIQALTAIKPVENPVFFVRPKRGRPKMKP